MYPFARAFANPQITPIRALFQYMSDPEMISFAGGYPDPQLFDTEGLQEAAARAWANSTECLQYANTDGIPKIKAQLIKMMAAQGITAEPANITVTTGSQQAFDLLLDVFIDTGDVVYLESPTFPSNIMAPRVHGAQLRPLPMDADGMDVAHLEALLREARAKGEALPKLIYTIPTFANPAGSTMPRARRLRLLELAVEYKFVIAEDDPYGELRFAGEPVPSLAALAKEVAGASDQVVYMSTLSKTVAPGLRIGWSLAPMEIARRCSVAKQTADSNSSAWTQSIAAEYLASGCLDQRIDVIRRAYGEKCQALCTALREKMGAVISFHEPQGGMFVWGRLTDGTPSAEFIKEAVLRKVMFVPGSGFYVGADADPATLRISFATPSVASIKEGVNRMAQAWQQLIANTPARAAA